MPALRVQIAQVDVGSGYGTYDASVVSVAAGWRHTCAVLQGGTVKCWGFDASGVLGYGTSEQILWRGTQVS